MPEKSNKSSIKKKNSSRSLNKLYLQSKPTLPQNKKDSLFESVEDLPFSNKHIKKQMKEHKTQKSLSGG